jgi:ADP-ribosylglycohydrolase
MSDRILDRVRGAVVGQAIGDALGAPTEGMSRVTIRERYGRVTDFLSDDPAGTDDTEYAALTARVLLEHGSALTAEHVAAAWSEALVDQTTPFDGGGFSEMEAIHNLGRGLLPPASGSDNHELWSDGSAMRVAPIGAYCAGDPAEAARLAGIDASVSHARDGIWCGQAIAAAVAAAVVTDDWRRVVDAGIAATPVASAPGGVTPEERLDELERRIALFHYPWADVAPEATALAFGVFAIAEGGYEGSVLGGVNIGRDADTIAAMAGAMAGGLRGAEAIPERWRVRLGPLRGSCIAAVAGTDLWDVAHRIAAAVEQRKGSHDGDAE